MDFPITYTGKNVVPNMNFAQGLPQTNYAVGQQMVGAERANLNKALQDEQFAVKEMSTPSVPLMSPVALKDQAEQLDNFRKKWGKRLSNNHGQLSTRDKIELVQDKQNLQALQKRYIADENAVRQEMQAYNKDVKGVYDPEHYQIMLNHFLETGQREGSLLSPKPVDPAAYFATHPIKLSQRTETKIVDGREVKTTVPLNEKDYRDTFNSKILGDERLLTGALNKFDELPKKNPQLFQKYLEEADANNNNKLDPGEKQNAILDYNWDIDKNIVMRSNKTVKPSTSFMWNGKKVDNTPQPYKGITLSGYTGKLVEDPDTKKMVPEQSGDAHFNLLPINSIPVRINVRKNEHIYGSMIPEGLIGSYTKGEIIGFDPQRDKYLVTITKSGQFGEEPTGGIVLRDVDKFNKKALDFPVEYNGKIMTVKQARELFKKEYKPTVPEQKQEVPVVGENNVNMMGPVTYKDMDFKKKKQYADRQKIY